MLCSDWLWGNEEACSVCWCLREGRRKGRIWDVSEAQSIKVAQRVDAEVREEDRRREGRRKREGRIEGRREGKVMATQAFVLHMLGMVVFVCHRSTWQADAGGFYTAQWELISKRKNALWEVGDQWETSPGSWRGALRLSYLEKLWFWQLGM